MSVDRLVKAKSVDMMPKVWAMIKKLGNSGLSIQNNGKQKGMPGRQTAKGIRKSN